MKALLIIGIVFAVTGVIALASGPLRGKGNLNISRRATLIVGGVLLVVGVVVLVSYLA
jgi:hypothetical protein